MKTEIAMFIIRTLIGIFGLAITLLFIAFPFLLIYAIYKAVTGIMTHNTELKSRYNDKNQPPKDRWTSGQ